MYLVYLAWKNIIHRPLSALLSIVLMAMGVAMVSLIITSNLQIEETFRKNLAGVDLIVGAKGNPIDLTLSSMYHISSPTGNIKPSQIAFLQKNPLIEKTIPLALGDNFDGFRIVGTTHQLSQLYSTRVKEGKLWENDLEVTIGSTVALEKQLTIGSSFAGGHGALLHDDQMFRVVGILEHSNSVADQLIFTNISSIWKIHEQHDHAKEEQAAEDAHEHQSDEKEYTSVLVFYRSPRAGLTLPAIINKSERLMAVNPAYELEKLNENLGIGVHLMQWIAYLIVFVAGISVFVSLYNSVKDRAYELALLRVKGARPSFLFFLILIEGVILCLIAYLLGILISHTIVALLSEYLLEHYRYSFNALQFNVQELHLLFVVLSISILATFLPAVQVLRNDIATTLSKNR